MWTSNIVKPGKSPVFGVAELNEKMRQRAIKEYRNTLEYLHIELQKSAEMGVRSGIYNLIEENTSINDSFFL